MFPKCLFLFAITACLAFTSQGSELLKSVAPNEAILQKFINLVQTHQLNVSIVTSLNQYWTNGQLQDVRDTALLLPPNSIHLTQTSLTEQIGKQWISDMGSMTVNGNAIASYRVATIQNGNILQTVVESSNEAAIPDTPSYKSITGVQHGIKGLVLDVPNWQVMYNFLLGNQENVQVIAADLNITVIDQSPSMPVAEITTIKNLIPKLWMMINDNTLMSQMLVEVLDKQLPQSNWNVIIGAEEVFLDVTKYVSFTVADDYLTVYALNL